MGPFVSVFVRAAWSSSGDHSNRRFSDDGAPTKVSHPGDTIPMAILLG